MDVHPNKPLWQFPALLPEEYLPGWIARFSRANRFTSPAIAYQFLLSRKTRPTAAEVFRYPSIMEVFRALPEGSFNSSNELMEKHTLFPLKMIFLNSRRREAMLIASSNGTLERKMTEWPKNAVFWHDSHWMRFCPDCVKEDIETYGEAYFRREHQIYFVTICERHSTRLTSSCGNCALQEIRKHGMLLPASKCACGDKLCESVPLAASQSISPWERRLAHMTRLVLTNWEKLSKLEFASTMFDLAHKSGFANGKRKIRSALTHETAEYWGRHLMKLCQGDSKGTISFKALCYTATRGCDPLRHILLLGFLMSGHIDKLWQKSDHDLAVNEPNELVENKRADEIEIRLLAKRHTGKFPYKGAEEALFATLPHNLNSGMTILNESRDKYLMSLLNEKFDSSFVWTSPRATGKWLYQLRNTHPEWRRVACYYFIDRHAEKIKKFRSAHPDISWNDAAKHYDIKASVIAARKFLPELLRTLPHANLVKVGAGHDQHSRRARRDAIHASRLRDAYHVLLEAPCRPIRITFHRLLTQAGRHIPVERHDLPLTRQTLQSLVEDLGVYHQRLVRWFVDNPPRHRKRASSTATRFKATCRAAGISEPMIEEGLALLWLRLGDEMHSVYDVV